MNCHYLLQFSSVQLLSRVRLFATPWIAVLQASLSITNSQSSPRLMFIESVMPSSHLILCRPLLLLPPIPPSIRVLAWILKLQTKNYWQCQNAKKKKKKFDPGHVVIWPHLDISQEKTTCCDYVIKCTKTLSLLPH